MYLIPVFRNRSPKTLTLYIHLYSESDRTQSDSIRLNQTQSECGQSPIESNRNVWGRVNYWHIGSLDVHGGTTWINGDHKTIPVVDFWRHTWNLLKFIHIFSVELLICIALFLISISFYFGTICSTYIIHSFLLQSSYLKDWHILMALWKTLWKLN